jgi:hypothetical protein
MRTQLVVVALALALGALACDRLNTTARTDAEITADVRQELTAAGVPAAIDVMTRDGVVTLAGNVSSVEIRTRAENVAEDVDGVDRVVNNLRASTMAGDAPAAPAIPPAPRHEPVAPAQP